ncbi:MAG: hypothetical protein ACRETL_12360, partial [Gammaproteobacteria bacterium]
MKLRLSMVQSPAAAAQAMLGCVSRAPVAFYEFFAGSGMARPGPGSPWLAATVFEPLLAAAPARFQAQADRLSSRIGSGGSEA